MKTFFTVWVIKIYDGAALAAFFDIFKSIGTGVLLGFAAAKSCCGE
jgi:hypothetical protein